MGANRLSKTKLAGIQPGQRVAILQYDARLGEFNATEGVVTVVPIPREHPSYCGTGSGSPYFEVDTGEESGLVLVDPREITAVLSDPDPLLHARVVEWLETRRPAALRRERASLARQLARQWIDRAGRTPSESLSVVPYRALRGPAIKLIGSHGRRVGEYLLPDGPLRMRVEGLRSAAVAALSEQGISTRTGALDDPYADVGYVERHDGRWTLHPIVASDIEINVELGSYRSADQQLVTRYRELADLMSKFLQRHGLEVALVSHSTERDGRADSEVPRSAPPRAELDADIKELRAALGLEPPVDDWPFAAPRFSEGPRRRLTEVARLLLPDHAAETLEREWRTTGWWWMPGIDNEWECSFASDRFAAGVWGPGLRAAVSRTRKSASVQFPPSAGERLDRWSSISPMHAAHVTMLELLEADPQWWDTVRHGDYVVAADDWVSRLQDSLSGLPGDERRSAPRGGSDGSNLLDYAAAGLVQLGGLALTDAATADAVRQCVICDTPYRVRALSAHEVYTVGSTQYCPLCCADVVQGVLHDQGAMDPWANTAIWAIRTVSAHDFSGPPSREQVAAPLRGPRERHLLQVLTRMLIPRDAEAVFQPSRKQRSWTEWLALAEVLGEGQRQSRGTWITATDGHLCRSMFERHIDDFMTHYDIAHNPEPQYPYDAGLNPAGLRADWQLADGTFVEALGLTGTSEYDQKVERKKALASRFNVPLLLITPADLGRLPHLFAPWLV